MAGGEMTGWFGGFFTEGFTVSTPLLSRIYGLHTFLLPLAVVALMGVHFWPVLWVYGLENLLGMWGMILGPAVAGGFLVAVPLMDREEEGTPGRHGWVGWMGLAVGAVLLGLWLYGLLGETQQHIGM